MARITLTVENVVVYLDTGLGRSAYHSYLRTTADLPPLSEAEWAAAFSASTHFAADIALLQNRVGLLEENTLHVTSTDW